MHSDHVSSWLLVSVLFIAVPENSKFLNQVSACGHAPGFLKFVLRRKVCVYLCMYVCISIGSGTYDRVIQVTFLPGQAGLIQEKNYPDVTQIDHVRLTV